MTMSNIQKSLSKLRCPFCGFRCGINPNFVKADALIKCSRCNGIFTYNDANIANISKCMSFFKTLVLIIIGFSIIIFAFRTVILFIQAKKEADRNREFLKSLDIQMQKEADRNREILKSLEKRPSRYKNEGNQISK